MLEVKLSTSDYSSDDENEPLLGSGEVRLNNLRETNKVIVKNIANSTSDLDSAVGEHFSFCGTISEVEMYDFLNISLSFLA
jgi:hypothetical protein